MPGPKPQTPFSNIEVQTNPPRRGGSNAEATQKLVSRALEQGMIRTVYQPVVNACAPARISFHEALLRIATPGGGLISPSQFLPAVAGTDLMLRLDRAALGNALAMLRAAPHARISVNIAPGALDDMAWMEILDRRISEFPDIGFRLIVEMTEDPAFLDHPACHGFLARLRAYGVTVALDDFGAGGTGFRHFRDYRFDIVKIDGCYGDGLHRNIDSQALITAMVSLAEHFEMMTVLEFVADADDAHAAQSLGIDCLQGYLFGRPVEVLSGLPKPGPGSVHWDD